VYTLLKFLRRELLQLSQFVHPTTLKYFAIGIYFLPFLFVCFLSDF